MKTPYWLLALLSSIVVTATTSFAQQPQPPTLSQAQSLIEQGQSRAAIAILEPLLQPESHVLDDAGRGIAWNLLASAYSDFEDYNKARQSYEMAIRILRSMPSQQVQYASALDGLGAVEESTGHFDESSALRIRARHLYESLGNHSGIAVTSCNLAMLAVEQKNLAIARQNMAKAFHEVQLATGFQGNDLAVMYTVKGALANAERDFRTAIAAYKQAIEIWTRIHGPRFFMLGIAYALLGDEFDKLGEYQEALSDLRHALTLLEDAPGKDSTAYLRVELAYAHALRDSGSKQEASLLEKEAKTTLTRVRAQQCVGCTISAEGFR
jgi:tetratricopeptide (TPR) repeat protein